MKIRLPYLMALTLAALGIFYGLSSGGLNASPAASITMLDSRQFDLASSGNATVISFFSPDCPISKKDAANLSELQTRYGDMNVDVIAVAMPYDQMDAVLAFRDGKNVEYALAHDSDGAIASAFPNMRFTPTTFLLDKSGKIVWRHTGRMNLDKASSQIADAIGTY